MVADDLSTARDRARLARDLTVRPGALELVICRFTPLEAGPPGGVAGFRSQLGAIGADLQQANSIADELSVDNVSCSVVHRLSVDPRQDVLRQVKTWQPDCVVASELGYADEVVEGLTGDGQLLLVGGNPTPAPDGPITVNLAGGSDSVAALALGIRLARTRSLPLEVAGESRGARWSRPSSLVDRLSRAGIQIQPAAVGHQPNGLLVTEGGGHPPLDQAVTHIRVRAARPGTADDVTRRVSEAAASTIPTLSRSQA